MTIALTRFLSWEEHKAMADEAVAKGWYRNDRRMFTPGMGWPQPYYFDPANPDAGGIACARGEGFLSVHYWRDWSHIRPPICVVCPNGETWEIDRKSSNGDGWRVTGEWPNLTCTPSIVVTGYHGFLQGGRFTANLDGPEPNGVMRPIVEREAT